MTITITSGSVEGRCCVFKSGADLSEYDPARLTVHAFESLPVTTGTLLRTNDLIETFGLTKDALGSYGAAAYGLAYSVAFAQTHCAGWECGGEKVTNPTREQIEALPLPILSAFVSRADTSRPVSAEDIETLKKKPTTDSPPE